MREKKANFCTALCNTAQGSFCLPDHLGLRGRLWGLKWKDKRTVNRDIASPDGKLLLSRNENA